MSRVRFASMFELCPALDWPEARSQKLKKLESPSLWHRVLEVVRVLPAVDLDIHRPGKPLELACARIGHNRNAQLRRAPRHGPAVLQNEAARASFQCPGNALHRDIS